MTIKHIAAHPFQTGNVSDKYEILSFQQMHNLLKHKNATVFV
jgi:hypothetical protein